MRKLPLTIACAGIALGAASCMRLAGGLVDSGGSLGAPGGGGPGALGAFSGTALFAPRAGESTILQLSGAFPAGTAFTYSSADGAISGSGTRVNFTPSAAFGAGTAHVTVTASAGGLSSSAVIPVTVTAAPPRLILDSVIPLGGGNYSVSGHAANLSNPASYSVASFVHTDVYYYQATYPLNSSGQFSIASVAFPAAMDRFNLMLIANTVNPQDTAHCYNTFTSTAGVCTGAYESHFGSRFLIPFDLNGTDSLNFANYYLTGTATNADPQLQNLLNRFSKTATAGAASPAYLVRSFYDQDQFYLYDQGLAVIAFSKGNQQAAAQKVLNALKNTQLASGSWYFSYNFDGTTIYPAQGGDYRTAGSIAWVVMGINAYHKAFNDTSYDAVATAALNYLNGQRASVTHNGVTANPVKFGPTNLGPFDQTKTFSFEHNVDSYSAFQVFGTLTANATYTSAAADIKNFLTSLWNGTYFYPGYSLAAPAGPNVNDFYLDTQTWGILGLGATGPHGEDYSVGLVSDCGTFVETAGYTNYVNAGVAGVFDWVPVGLAVPYTFVWSEGTLGLVAAMNLVKGANGKTISCASNGVTLGAGDFLASIQGMVDADGGVRYSTTTANTDFMASSSVAGTAWLYFARNGINPYSP